MKKAIVTILAISLMALPAWAQCKWSYSWDWNDWSTQGWIISGAGSGIAANPVESNQDNVPDPSNGTGAVYLPDGSIASFYLPEPCDSFIFSAEVAGGAWDINRLTRAGLGYRHTYDADTTSPNSLSPADAVTAWMEGKEHGNGYGSGQKVGFNDTYAGLGSSGGDDWLESSGGGGGGFGAGVMTIELTIDYNATVPGQIIISANPVDYIYSGSDGLTVTHGPAATNDALGGAVEPISMIRLGGAYSWSQFYADNAYFCCVPEPATLGLLGIGSLALLRRRRA